MNEKAHQLASELTKLAPDELEEVISLVRLKTRARAVTKLLAPSEEYRRNRSFLEAGGVGFEAGKDQLGHLVLPPETRVWSSPSLFLPNGSAFVLAIVGGTERRRIVTL